jgi:hypothetical protein
MLPKEVLSEAAELFKKQGRLIRLSAGKTIVFVGDTHGDREATEIVFDHFLSSDTTIVFLGDIVDRGSDSPGNLELILRTKLAHPDDVYLLMGNHEGWAVGPFSPADFWQRLDPEEAYTLAETLAHLPYAAWHPRGVLALHGALPDVAQINEIETIRLGSSDWQRITWGDWADAPGHVLDLGVFGRPTFGRDAFETISNRLGLSSLVRSHQPFAPLYLYENRCLTIFTSNAYGGTERRVAILKSGKVIHNARDLELSTI